MNKMNKTFKDGVQNKKLNGNKHNDRTFEKKVGPLKEPCLTAQATGKNGKEEKDKEFLRFLVKNTYEMAYGFSERMAVECIKKVISDGLMGPKELVTELGIKPVIVFKALNAHYGSFQKENFSEEFKRFIENSKLIFENEEYFESSYLMRKAGNTIVEYKYTPASHSYRGIFYQIYKHLSGKKYSSPEELKEIFSSILKGKRILDVGCGPGFALKVLKKLGASVAGIECDEKYRDKTKDINVEYADAAEMTRIFGDKKFDIIISADFFSEAIIPKRKALDIALKMYALTEKNGLGIHQILFEKIHPVVNDFYNWWMCREHGLDYERDYKEYWNGLTEDERESRLWTNRPSLQKEELEMIGFEVLDWSKDGWLLNMVIKKKD